MVDEVFMNEIIDSMEHERPTDAEMLSMAREDEEDLCAGLNDALAEAGVTPCGRGSFSYAEAFTRIIRERADAQAEIDRLRAENDRFRKIVIAAIQARDGMMPRAQTCMHIADALDGLTLSDLSTAADR